MRKALSLVLFLTLVGFAQAAPSAVRLHLCTVLPCPHPVPTLPPLTTAAGATFNLYVTAADNLGTDDMYTGTIQFSSSDPLASLPTSYTFILADQGMKNFTAILRTPGDQTITVTDASSGLKPGTLTFVVTGAVTEPVPTLSEWMKILFALALVISGTWLVRLRN
jgi:hypothetical protein